MIIDMHGHAPLRGFKREYVFPKDQASADSEVMEEISKAVEDMDKAWIDKRVLLAAGKDLDPAFHYAETSSSTGVTTLSSTEWIRKAIEKYPDRFLGFACINPTKEEAIQELEEAVCKYKFKGVKLHPCHHNYEADDKRVYPFYKECVESGICVSYHTGFSGDRRDHLKNVSPIPLDEVARDFPELKIIICHVGAGWFQEAVFVAKQNPNVYVDTASINVHGKQMIYPIEATLLVRRVVEVLGDSKVLYGTDNLEHDNNIFFMMETGLKEESIRKIMGKNAARLLNIPLEAPRWQGRMEAEWLKYL